MMLEVVEIETGAVVHSVDVSSKTDNQIYKCMMGMMRNMDLDRFFVREA